MSSNLQRFDNIRGVGQLKGPIPHKDVYGKPINLIGLFDLTFDGKIIKLGIHAPEGSIVLIDNREFVIGITDFLEYESGTQIKSLAFETEITKQVIIDFVYVQN